MVQQQFTAKTGVFTVNRVPGMYDIIFSEGINTTLEEREKIFFDELREKHGLSEDVDIEESYPELIDEYELELIRETSDTDSILIGFKKTETGEYTEDETQDFSCIIGELWGFVTRSKWVCRCAKGSPCIPYQGDLENPGNELCFTLPVELWEEYKPEHMEITEINPEDYLNKTALCIKHGPIMDNPGI